MRHGICKLSLTVDGYDRGGMIECVFGGYDGV